MAETLVVYQGNIIRYQKERRTVETVIAHPGSGWPRTDQKNPTDIIIIPFNDLDDAHRYCIETSSCNVWIESKGATAHIPNGKRLP